MNAKLIFFQKGTLDGIIPTFVDKADGQDVLTLEPLPDASPNYIAIMTEFPTVPTYNTLKNDVLSIQDSIQTSQPDAFEQIASILISVLKCHQQATGLNKAINCRVDNFKTQFDEKGFVHVLMSLT